MKLKRDVRRSYWDLLKSYEWLSFSRDFIEDKGSTCFQCGESDPKNLQVHHIRYIEGRLPWEYDESDLRVLCKVCHESVHLVADQIWVELLRFDTHELEVVLKRIRSASSATDLDLFDLAANRRRQSCLTNPRDVLKYLLHA